MTFCPLANLAQINHHLSAEGANKVFILHNKTAGHQNKMTQKQQNTRTPKQGTQKQQDAKTPGNQNTRTQGHQNTRTPKHKGTKTPGYHTGLQKLFVMKMPT